MKELENIRNTLKTLTSLQEDWMLVDDFPDKDFLVLVNTDREVVEDFYPKKGLIQAMEMQGLIKNHDNLNDPQPKTFSYFVTYPNGTIKEVIEHNPYVYYYKLTRKGKAFLVKHKNR